MLHQRTGISCELQSLSGDALREHKALFDANFPTAVTYPDAAPTGKASCWVETPAAGDGEEGEDGNQGFLIMWNANGYGENMAVYITLDGAKQRMPTPHYAEQDYGMVTGELGPNGSERPYEFSRITARRRRGSSSEEGEEMDEDEGEEAGAALKRGVGTIVVEFKKCTLGQAGHELNDMDGANEGGPVTERGVKGQLLHKTRFGQARRAGTTRYVHIDQGGRTAATFEFKYRNRDLLIADGIIDEERAATPVPAPPPASPTPARSRAASSAVPAPASKSADQDVKPDIKPIIDAQARSGSGSSSAASSSAAAPQKDVKPVIAQRRPSTPPEGTNTGDKGKKRAASGQEDAERDALRERAERLEAENKRMRLQYEQTEAQMSKLYADLHAGGFAAMFPLPDRPAAGPAVSRQDEDRKPSVKAEPAGPGAWSGVSGTMDDPVVLD